MPGVFHLREFNGGEDLICDLLVCDIVPSCSLLRMFQGRSCLKIEALYSSGKAATNHLSPFSE
jgi:hypothetical protein